MVQSVSYHYRHADQAVALSRCAGVEEEALSFQNSDYHLSEALQRVLHRFERRNHRSCDR